MGGMALVETLVAAIKAGDSSRALSIVRMGFPIAEAGRSAQVLGPALAAAIEAGAVDVFQALLAAGADPLKAGAAGDATPLHLASKAGQLDFMEQLIARGADVNAQIVRPSRMGDGRTPLTDAILNKRLDAVQLLVKHGADVLAKSPDGTLALDVARHGGKRIAAYLRKMAAASPALKERVDIFGAARNGLTEFLTKLLDEGSPVDDRDSFGRTPLHHAVLAAQLETVQLLLARGADPNSADLRGFRPLALQDESVEVAQALLDAGADPEALMFPGMRVIDHHLGMGSKKAVKELLLAATAPAGRPVVAGPPPGVEELRAHLKAMPELARSEKFQTVTARLEKLFNRNAEPWKRRKGGIAFHAVSLGKRLAAEFGERPVLENLQRLAAEVRAAGFTVFCTDAMPERDRVGVVLLPLNEPGAAALACGANGDNYGRDANAVAGWLLDLHASDPFVILGAGHDFVRGQLLGKPKDAEKLASRMIEFCPDMVNQAGAHLRSLPQAQQAAALARSLESGGWFFFWWD